MRKKLFSILLIVVILINVNYVLLQEVNPSIAYTDEEAKNRQWKQMREDYTKRMTEIENNSINLEEQDVQQMRQMTQYKNQIIDKLKQNSETIAQTSNRFNSFLSLQKSIPESDSPDKFFLHGGFTTWINGIPAVGAVNFTPWSGSYWPMRNGGIAMRYQKNEKNTIGLWDQTIGAFTYFFIWAESVSRYAQPWDHKSLETSPDYAKYVDENYSAAEKYDLLVGDYDFTLTNFSLNEGAKHAFGGDVIGWFGICHGWAPASYFFPRPTRSIVLTAANGMAIKFQPDDIKGLLSLFFANATYKTLFIGYRCDYYYPDPGWFTSPSCASINPAAFMIIIGNQVGLRGKNLTFDPSADPEIWNHPIISYEFRFYNPLTNDFFGDAASAKVSMDFLRGSSDSFLQFVASAADSRAKSAVGVFMKIKYSIETDITDLRHDDTTAEDTDKTDEFDSIIELDEGDNIVGGEWKFKSHPNFIWHYDENEPIQGVSDEKLPAWYQGPEALELIKQASSHGQPIKAIINTLAFA